MKVQEPFSKIANIIPQSMSNSKLIFQKSKAQVFNSVVSLICLYSRRNNDRIRE